MSASLGLTQNAKMSLENVLVNRLGREHLRHIRNLCVQLNKGGYADKEVWGLVSVVSEN